ncbi:MAG: Fic family protein [archaeon]
MANLIERKSSGTTYFYLEKNIKLGKNKWKKVSIYLGKKSPLKEELKKKEKLLEEKMEEVLGSLYDKRLSNYSFSFLSKKELSEVERIKDNFLARFNKLSDKKKAVFNKKLVLDFVYTTLRTEGVDVDFSDVQTAFTILKKKKSEFTLNKKIVISSAMITGLNFLPEIKLTEKDVLRLHGIIMTSFEDKSPGQLRDDQRIIAKFDPLTFQSKEINYRPPSPQKIKTEYKRFFEWFKENNKVHPLELAALVHLKVYLIHPFKDGNKRICRLLFNKILQDAGYPLLNISKDTSDYFKTLIKSVETKREEYFIKFCFKAFMKQVKNKRLK